MEVKELTQKLVGWKEIDIWKFCKVDRRRYKRDQVFCKVCCVIVSVEFVEKIDEQKSTVGYVKSDKSIKVQINVNSYAQYVYIVENSYDVCYKMYFTGITIVLQIISTLS